MPHHKNQSGQALLIVLLALAAVASVALTVSSRTTTDVAVTTNVEDSQRAFTAAEAGIEQVLLDQNAANGSPQTVGNAGAIYQVTANTIPDNPQEYAYPFELSPGDVSTLWFMSHDTNSQLSCSGLPCYTGDSVLVCWGQSGANSTEAGALEITIYNRDGSGEMVVSRTTVDPDATRRGENNFSLAGSSGSSCGTIDGVNYAFSQNIDFSSLGINNFGTAGNLVMMRTRLLYNSETQPIGFRTVSAGANLPTQGVRVDSVGSSGTAQRRLEAFSLYPVIPSMFEAAVYSPPGLIKN